MSESPLRFPNRPTHPLLLRSQEALAMSQRQIGEALGVSQRTVSRWYARGPGLTIAQLHTLARLVHPRDPDLAADLAAAASETLESLGIVAPKEVVPSHLVVDSVVCAAADSLGVAPGPVRHALHAAFKRARALGLRMEDVEAALAPSGKPDAPG